MLNPYEKLQFIECQPGKYFTALKIIARTYLTFLCPHKFRYPYRKRPQKQDFPNEKAAI